MSSHKPKCCQDPRCLYYTQTSPLLPDFSAVTTETREGRGLWERCNRCNLVINRSGVEPTDAGNFYNSTYVEKNSYSQGELLSAKEHFEARLDSIKPIADAVTPYLEPSMRVFELGAATGELLYCIQDKVKYCCANEINQLYATFIQQELHIDSSFDDYLNLQCEEPFDCIISINTIDHMYNPVEVAEKIFDDLCAGGLFYVEVPNDLQALKEYLLEPQRSQFKKFMYQKAHYYSFTFETLRRLLVQTGFTIELETSRHDYTLNNYLQWYFLGQPQKQLKAAMGETDVHEGNSPFELEMNQLFHECNQKFKEFMKKHKVGETLCMLARKPA